MNMYDRKECLINDDRARNSGAVTLLLVPFLCQLHFN